MKKIQYKIDPAKGTLGEESSKKYFSTLGFAVALYMVIALVSGTVSGIVAANYAPSILENPVTNNLLSLVCNYVIALPAFIIVIARLPKDTNPSEKLGAGSFVGALCVAFLFMSFGASVSSILMELLHGAFNVSTSNPVADMTYGNHWVINLIFMGLIPPVLEELVFRKILCDRLLPLGEGYAVVLSALVFALAHGNFYQFFYAFLMGLLFALLYVKTGRVRYGIAIHMIINVLGSVFIPWVISEILPLFDMISVEEMMNVLLNGTEEERLAINELIAPFMLPTYLYFGYTVIAEIIGPFAGIFLLFKNARNIRFRGGLLPPDKEGRISNILCNWGVAIAITVFAGMFILSLLS